LRFGAKILPDGAEKWVGQQAQGIENYGNRAMQQNLREAQQALASGQRDATQIRQGTQAAATNIDHGTAVVANAQRQGSHQAATAIQQGADATGQTIRTVTDKAPVAGMTVFGAAGAVTSTVATHAPVNVQNTINLYNTITVLQRGNAVATEAVFRHGMKDSVIPSLDAVVEKQERAAKQVLGPNHGVAPPQDRAAPTAPAHVPEPTPAPAAQPQRTGMLINDPLHPNYHLFDGARQGVFAIDRTFNIASDLGSEQLAGTLAAKACLAEFPKIHGVALGDDKCRVYAIDTDGAHQRIVSTEVIPGRQQSLEVSTQQVDAANSRAAEQNAQKQALQDPTLDNPVRATTRTA
jgi:hypothetical protein